MNPAGALLGFSEITRDLTERTIEEEQRQLIIEAAPNGPTDLGGASWRVAAKRTLKEYKDDDLQDRASR